MQYQYLHIWTVLLFHQNKYWINLFVTSHYYSNYKSDAKPQLHNQSPPLKASHYIRIDSFYISIPKALHMVSSLLLYRSKHFLPPGISASLHSISPT